jgi:hypothetical protein
MHHRGHCADGTCTGAPLVCNDGNACNGVETCDPGTGCLAGTPPDCNDDDECTADTCEPTLGCQNTSEPTAYTICRLDILVNAILGAPADAIGGVRRKTRYLRMANTALRSVERTISAPPRQRLRLQRRALKSLRRLRATLQRAVDARSMDPELGNELIGLVVRALTGLQRMGT